MKNSDMPAMPIVREESGSVSWDGLTKREVFAAMAMQGIVSRESSGNIPVVELAEYAITVANVLLTKLEEDNG